ncbi:hypothetical protein [Breoghania sp.]|uniref:hypothetical protein n=1 Tax=Breoghania sp. TaxID=2065378 RepID=UPI002604E466|nr:hypothetical protein [Breoghania sp.]MDJ0931432.1 hypothetical protein [Breoghania sp.]
MLNKHGQGDPADDLSASAVERQPDPSPSGRPINWLWLALLSLVIIALLEAVGLPAAMLLGAMLAAIVVALRNARLAVPRYPIWRRRPWSD